MYILKSIFPTLFIFFKYSFLKRDFKLQKQNKKIKNSTWRFFSRLIFTKCQTKSRAKSQH